MDRKEELLKRVSQPKTELLRILIGLESIPKCVTASKQLATIIARLEGWQNNHLNK